MIVFEHVGLRYGPGPEVLSDISFTLEPGSFHFLTGPSGAGKTTLMRLMGMTLRPTRGILTIFDMRVHTASRAALALARRKVGIVFQDARLLPDLCVFDNVALPLRIAGSKEADIKRDVSAMLEWVGLGDYARMSPALLSGGQAQRAAIARAVITRPRLVLADEPTGNVDEDQAMRLMTLFEELSRRGTTLVVATHFASLLRRYSHPCLRLKAGRLIRILKTPAAKDRLRVP